MATKAARPTWKGKSLWPELKETLATSNEIVVYDLETTGLSSKNDRVIEIAAVKFSIAPDFELVESGTYHTYINPERDIPAEITALTGITNEMVAAAPTEQECIKDIKDFFDGCIVGGYNIERFDNKFMQELCGRYGFFFEPTGSVDGMKMAKNRLNKGIDVEDFKLQTVGSFFGIDFQAHSALDDTRTVAQLIQIFLREYAEEEAAKEAMSEDELPTTKGTLRPNIERIAFWEGFRGFSRIFVNMDIGSVYYDIRSAAWGGKEGLDITELDMEWIEQEAFRIVGVKTEREFAAFRGSVRA